VGRTYWGGALFYLRVDLENPKTNKQINAAWKMRSEASSPRWNDPVRLGR